jgi:hypothetical protein
MADRIEVRMVVDQRAVRDLGNESEVGVAMRPRAEQILASARMRAPSWLNADWYVKAGKGPQGAFAQAIAKGEGAVLAEYGGLYTPASAMFRSSI